MENAKKVVEAIKKTSVESEKHSIIEKRLIHPSYPELIIHETPEGDTCGIVKKYK